ncbi:MAG: hypothetical protein HXS50_04385 [Theionarchaea archaeon]|nr:hypothetical protein [Theionarchaea archaeon]
MAVNEDDVVYSLLRRKKTGYQVRCPKCKRMYKRVELNNHIFMKHKTYWDKHKISIMLKY